MLTCGEVLDVAHEEWQLSPRYLPFCPTGQNGIDEIGTYWETVSSAYSRMKT